MNATEVRPPPAAMLFLEKVYLEPCRHEPRGVEIFNLNLLRDLARLGRPVTALVHPDWAPVLRDRLGDAAPELLLLPRGLPGFLGAAAALFRVRHRRFSCLLTANVGDRLIPALNLIRQFGLVRRAALLAHREPTPRFVRAHGQLPTAVAAVNRRIAGHFEGGQYGRVEVFYGVTDAERFLQPRPAKPESEPIDFCLIGDLNSAWKGADLAVEGFRLMEPAVAAGCRLHLASFREERSSGDPRILCYRWMPFEEMPAFLGRMDVMLVLSRDEGVMRETFSQAAVQGMLAGLPLIVTDLPILTEKVNEGGGLIIRAKEELAAAMMRMARDPGLRRRMGEAARATARGRYLWRTDTFLERFCGEPASPGGAP